MIFLTVGTILPFDRLVRGVDHAVGRGIVQEDVYAQVGQTKYQPKNFPAVTSLDKPNFDEKFRRASAVICHAGMGSITMAMDLRKPILVMPRLSRFKEHVNDHQMSIVKRYEAEGYFLVAYSEEDLLEKIPMLKDFCPCQRVTHAENVVARIKTYLDSLGHS